MTKPERPGGMLGRLVSPFVDLRRGEHASALLTFGHFFFLMVAYYVLKPVRTSLVLETFGARNMPFLYLITTSITLVAGWAFNRVVERFDRFRFLVGLQIFFVGVLGLFWFVLATDAAAAHVCFFFWVSVFILFAVAAFWGLTNEIYDSDQGRRLYGALGAGGLLGGMAGSWLVKQVVPLVGTRNLLLVSLGFMALTVPLILGQREAYRRARTRRREQDVAAGRGSGMSRGSLWSDLKMTLGHRYVRCIFFIVMCTTSVITFLDYQYNVAVEAAFPKKPELQVELPQGDPDELRLSTAVGGAPSTVVAQELSEASRAAVAAVSQSVRDARTGFLGWVHTNMLMAALLLQFFVTGPLLKRFGATVGLTVLPALCFLAVLALIFRRTLAVAAWVHILTFGASYSVNTASKELLYIPTPAAVKYKAKSVSDAFGYRAGDSVAAIAILLWIQVARLSAQSMLFLTFFLFGLWIPVVRSAGRQWKRAVASDNPMATLGLETSR